MGTVWTKAVALLAGLLIGTTAAAPRALAEELELIGRYELPHGLKLRGVAFGGISAIDYDADKQLFLAISDDRGRRGPPRFYVLGLDLSEQGVRGLDVVDVKPILGEDDAPLAVGAVDPEALRLGPGGVIYWAQEGGAGAPSVGVMGMDGRQIAAFDIPPYYTPGKTADDAPTGARDNLGFEALTVGPKGEVVVGMEQALKQDGPKADVAQGSLSRILVLSPQEGRAVAEHLYPVGPVTARPIPPDGFRTNGLVELLARPEGGFYALERAFVAGQGGAAAIYKTSFEGASNVLGAASLDGLAPEPMKKELLYSLVPRPDLPVVDNLEGMSFGPEIGGRRTLVLISDDNFRSEQATQILLFAIQD